MPSSQTKHIWIFLSAYGIMFALLSWIYEIATTGLWEKGVLAMILGFGLYRLMIDKV